MLQAFISWVLGEQFGLLEQPVQRPWGGGTECGTLEGQGDGSASAERTPLSGR